MPAKVVCPSCHMSLNAPDELLGQTVKCEECGSTFTARAPARPRRDEPVRGEKSRYRRRDDDEDDAPRSRRSSRDEDDDYDRPRRRPRKAKGSNALPFILAGGGLVFFVVVGVGVGLYFLFSGSKKSSDPAFQPGPNNQFVNPGGFGPLPPAGPLPNNPPAVAPAQPAGAQKVRLSNPRWSFGGGLGGDFEVDYEFTNGQRPVGGMYQLRWKYSDGTNGSANLHMGPFDGATGTWKINVIGGMGRGGRGRGMEIWVEEGGFGRMGNGTKVSNTVTLN